MPEEDLIRHLSENEPLDKVLETTANVVEGIGRNNGGEYDNLTAAILEVNHNSVMKEKKSPVKKALALIAAISALAGILFLALYFLK